MEKFVIAVDRSVDARNPDSMVEGDDVGLENLSDEQLTQVAGQGPLHSGFERPS